MARSSPRDYDRGLHIQSRWDGDESICEFTPEDFHTSFPGFVGCLKNLGISIASHEEVTTS